MHHKAIPLFCFVLMLVVLSCSSKNPANSGNTGLTDEAKLAALWVSDEALVPADLAREIQNKLESLRDQYSREIPQVNTTFKFPAEEKMIIIDMEPYNMVQFLWGTYHEWDSLNQLYGLDTIVIKDTARAYLHLEFKKQINTLVVASEYSNLPGIQYACANFWMGDGPNVYPWIVDGQVVFLVREAKGDCEAGCMYNKFWYFRSNGNQFDLIGEFEYGAEWSQNPQWPDWWDEIKPAYYKYRMGSWE